MERVGRRMNRDGLNPEAASPAVSALIEAGFELVGCWRPAAGSIELDGAARREAGVYAYVVEGVVKYVGSAQRGLHGRLRRYAITKTLRTSARVRGEIQECLTCGKTVEVYALVPPPLVWKELPVDLVVGLEEGLIRQLQPAWNRRSNPGNDARIRRPESSSL